MPGAVLLLLAPALLLLGALLTILGFRGKRLDDHPLCRNCRFDLVGLTKTNAPPPICPECGRSLASPRSIRRGHRRIRRRLLIPGAALLLLGLAAGAFAAYAHFRGANLNPCPYLPTAVLIRAATWPTTTRPEVLGELYSRLQSGSLAPAEIDALILHGLAVQADLKRPWLSEWGGIIELAKKRGLLTNDQVIAYYKNAVAGDVEIQQTGTLPQAIHIQPGPSTPRVNANGLGLNLLIKSESVWLDAIKLKSVDSEWRPNPFNPSSSSTLGAGTPFALGPPNRTRPTFPLDVPPGDHSLRVRYILQIPPNEFAAPGPEDFWTIDVTRTQTIAPPAQTLIQFTDDPAIAQQLIASLRIGAVVLARFSDGLAAELLIDFDHPPLRGMISVLLRTTDGAETPLGNAELDPSIRYNTRVTARVPRDFHAAKVDLVLRTGHVRGLRDHLFTKLWVGQIIVTDVPVVPDQPLAILTTDAPPPESIRVERRPYPHP